MLTDLNQGYVKIHRTVWDHPVFNGDYNQAGIFVWMINQAAWRDTEVRYRGCRVQLKRGQLCVSIRDISRKFGASKSTISRLLKRLESGTMVGQHRDSSGTPANIITICNYDKYQASNQGPGTGVGQGWNGSGTQNKEEKKRRSTSKDGDALFSEGRKIFGKNGGSIVGKMLKEHEADRVRQALEASKDKYNPVSYAMAALKGADPEEHMGGVE